MNSKVCMNINFFILIPCYNYVVLAVCVHVYVFVCLCMCTGACAQGYRGQRSTLSASFCCSTSVFRAGSLSEAWAQGLAALAGHQGCFCLPLQRSLPNTSFYLRAAHQVQVHMLGQQGLYWLRHLLSPLCVVFMWGNIHDLCPCLCNLPQIFSYFKKLENYEYINISTMRFWGK